MSALTAFYVKYPGGAQYKAGYTDCYVELRANHYSEAKITFPDSTGLYTNVFANEDEVQVYVGDPSAGGTKLLHGYIDNIDTIRNPNMERTLTLHITDWGSYLSSKRTFEKKIFRAVTPQALFITTALNVTDGVDTLSSANVNSITYTNAFKDEFVGTYVKDVWNALAEEYNAEYYCDEALILNVFESYTKFADFGSGTVRIRDIAPSLGRDLQVLHRKPYNLTLDNSERYRNVIVTNGIMEGFPTTLEDFETLTYFDDKNTGKLFSRYYKMGANSFYFVEDVGNSFKPVELAVERIDVGTAFENKFPSIKLNVSTGAIKEPSTFVYPHDNVSDNNFNLTINNWQELSFFVKSDLAGVVRTNFTLWLIDDPATKFWKLELHAWVPTGAWTYFRLQLPSTTSNAELYTGGSWSKTGLPTKINQVFFDILPAGAWTGSVSFGQMFFYRTQRATASAAGNPPTQKIVVKKDYKSSNRLQQFANAELSRTNRNVVNGDCTILGDARFLDPGYLVDVDFTTTLGTGRSATGSNGARLNRIRHYLEDSIYYTDLEFNNAFHRQ